MKRINSFTETFNNSAYKVRWQPNSLSEKRVTKIIDLVGNGKKVLDIGCYDGTISSRIKNNGNQVIGIDVSSSAVRLALKNNIKAYKVNIETEDIPSKFGKFDIVVAGEIIEHILDTDAFLEKIYKVLNPHGQLVITTPNIAGLGPRLSLLLGKLPWMIENSVRGIKAGHIRYFTVQELSKLLFQNKFTVNCITTDSIGIGKQQSIPFIDRIFPRLGRIIILKAQKNEKQHP